MSVIGRMIQPWQRSVVRLLLPAILRDVVSSSQVAEQPRSDTRRLILWGCVLLILHLGVLRCGRALFRCAARWCSPVLVEVLSKRARPYRSRWWIVRMIERARKPACRARRASGATRYHQIEADLGVLETKLFADLAMKRGLVAEQNNSTTISFSDELVKASRHGAELAMQSQQAEFSARSGFARRGAKSDRPAKAAVGARPFAV